MPKPLNRNAWISLKTIWVAIFEGLVPIVLVVGIVVSAFFAYRAGMKEVYPYLWGGPGSDSIYFLIWYISGLILASYWPIKYRHNMTRKDWSSFFVSLPFVALAGPLAFILGFPV